MESDDVGVILDTSVLVASERRGHNAIQILQQLNVSYGAIDFGVSVVSIAELMHGAYRASRTEIALGD